MSDFKKERDELVELFGVHFENAHHLPPLGSRILATLIVDSCEKKTSFEDLVEGTGASKSSVSTNLNLLLKMGKISYYTLPGDRKKYYRPTPFSERFSGYLKMIEEEKIIIKKYHSYREHGPDCETRQKDLEKIKIYEGHVSNMEQVILSIIGEFKKFEENDPI